MPSGTYRKLCEAYESDIFRRKKTVLKEKFEPEVVDKVESPETEKDEVRIGKEILELVGSSEDYETNLARVKELAQELIDLHTTEESPEDDEMASEPNPQKPQLNAGGSSYAM